MPRLLLVLSLLLLPACSNSALNIVHIANEGFLIEADGEKVVIDAFVREPYSIYAAAPQLVDRMVAGEPPFDDVSVALVSHYHRDHFQPEAAADVLHHQPVMLVTSQQVIRTLRESTALLPKVYTVRMPDTAQDNAPVRFEMADDNVSDIRFVVEAFPLSHGSGRFTSIENLGHLVHIGGFTVLHIGDAEPIAENFARFNLDQRRIDVALIPYWYYLSESGRNIIDRYFKSRLQIAVHVPRHGEDEKNVSAVRDLGVEIAERPLQRWRLSPQ